MVRRVNNPWLDHLKKVRKAHPDLSDIELEK